MSYLCHKCSKEVKVVRYEDKKWICDKGYFDNLKEDVIIKDNGKTKRIQSGNSK